MGFWAHSCAMKAQLTHCGDSIAFAMRCRAENRIFNTFLIYDFGFTIYENFGFTRLRVTAETPRQAIDEEAGRTARKIRDCRNVQRTNDNVQLKITLRLCLSIFRRAGGSRNF